MSELGHFGGPVRWRYHVACARKWIVSLAPGPADWDFPSDMEPAVLASGRTGLRHCGLALECPSRLGNHSVGDGKRGLPLWFGNGS